jgi:hypothetical protein
MGVKNGAQYRVCASNSSCDSTSTDRVRRWNNKKMYFSSQFLFNSLSTRAVKIFVVSVFFLFSFVIKILYYEIGWPAHTHCCFVAMFGFFFVSPNNHHRQPDIIMPQNPLAKFWSSFMVYESFYC